MINRKILLLSPLAAVVLALSSIVAQVSSAVAATPPPGLVGFGAGTTGGTTTVHVTNTADFGTGSLRAALAVSGRAIVFDGNFTITLASVLNVPSSTTIDGRGRVVTISGNLKVPCLQLTNVSNVIIESVALTRCGDPALTAANTTPDAINLDHATGVWIDHDALSHTGDKLIQIDNGSSKITVSWCHFLDQEQVFEIGDYYDRANAASQTVTVHHNWFDHVGYRMPVTSYGKMHSFNNFLVGWRTYGIGSKRIAQVLAENDVLRATTNTKAIFLVSSPPDKDPRKGYIRGSGNLLEGGAKIQTNQPTLVFKPPYAYTLEVASDALAVRVSTSAGPH